MAAGKYRGNGEEARAGIAGLTVTLNVNVTKGRPERGGLFAFPQCLKAASGRRRSAGSGDSAGHCRPGRQSGPSAAEDAAPDKSDMAKKLEQELPG